MHIASIKQYLESPVQKPYFLFINDALYASTITDLLTLRITHVKTSMFCSDGDKLPDIDELLSYIKGTIDDEAIKNIFVTGLGEYLALRGSDEASFVLSRLKDFNIGNGKVVFVMRGLTSQVAKMTIDPRFDSRRFSIVGNGDCDLSFTLVAPSIGCLELCDFKTMLEKLENGDCGCMTVSTTIDFEHAMLTVQKIHNAYAGVMHYVGTDFNLPYDYESDEFWEKLLNDLSNASYSIDKVFEQHGINSNLESNFYNHIIGGTYHSWLYFIYLKRNIDTLPNSYLQFVLDRTTNFADFKSNVLDTIINIQHTDEKFTKFYYERKKLVEKFPESDIANFVVNNRKITSESIYKLTDNTKTEREEVIAWLSRNGMVPDIEKIYPSLSAYLKKYIFKCPDLADLLTEYFEAYKRQKLLNTLEPDFLAKVDDFAQSPRKFYRLPTRNEVIGKLDKEKTYLYWLDALGVEFLAFIESLALKRGLAISVYIARAELPTITSMNRDFFDGWIGRKKKNDDLDKTKHKDVGGYNFTNNELPIHLAKELDIITAVIEEAATELSLRKCKRFLIVSDHGASRLAVLRRKEERYETDTKGEHSGRCCKITQPYDHTHNLAFAAEENEYLVLADYGRFKGSRAANVEVHGGASLEEVVIPIIELSLQDESVSVVLVEESVTVDFHIGTEITLFFNTHVKNVSIILNERTYSASQTDDNHYVVKLLDIKRAGEYPADVYVGDNLVGKILIKAHGKSGKINDAFDGLF